MRHFTLTVLAVAWLAGSAWAQTIPEKIGFQGRLTDAAGNPVTGTVNLTFKLYTAGGTEKWTSGALGATLNGGLYSVELGDATLGALPFDEPYLLGIKVESDNEMTPRYPLLASPYAFRAKQANDADMLDGLHATAFATLGHNHDAAYWKLGGNAVGAAGVLGTTDNVALDLIVNGARTLRLEPNAESPNVIGGGSGNIVASSAKGAVIGGGGNATDPNLVTDDYGTVVGGKRNRAGNNTGTTSDASYATVGGGFNNTASSGAATVGGGSSNTASDNNATVGGGSENTASKDYATIGGGYYNMASGFYATVGGGYNNTANGDDALIGGGYNNTASGGDATVVGGYSNTASGFCATVGGGYSNFAGGDYSFAAGRQAWIDATTYGTFLFADQNAVTFYSAAANEFAARATGGVRFVTAINGSGAPTKSFSIAGSGNVTAQGTVTATGFSGPLTGTANNADQLDNLHAASFLRSDASSALTSGILTLNTGTTLAIGGTLTLPSTGITGAGTGSGLDADLLDGQHAAAFAASSHAHAASDITSGILPVSVGGTGQGSSLTAYGVMYGASGAAMASTAAGTTGQVLTATTGIAPTWQQPILSPIKSNKYGGYITLPDSTNKIWTSSPALTVTPMQNGTLHITGTTSYTIYNAMYIGMYISNSSTQPTNDTAYSESRFISHTGAGAVAMTFDYTFDVSAGVTYYIWMGANYWTTWSTMSRNSYSDIRITATLHSSTGL